MSRRRPYTDNVKCAHEGCAEYGHYSYDTRRDAIEGAKWRRKFPYRCSRHSSPDSVLSTEKLVTQETLVSVQKEHGVYWNGSHGLISGNGYKAFAKDFPAGTKITITATIELPAPETIAQEGGVNTKRSNCHP